MNVTQYLLSHRHVKLSEADVKMGTTFMKVQWIVSNPTLYIRHYIEGYWKSPSAETYAIPSQSCPMLSIGMLEGHGTSTNGHQHCSLPCLEMHWTGTDYCIQISSVLKPKYEILKVSVGETTPGIIDI